jgi:hypothetical protein
MKTQFFFLSKISLWFLFSLEIWLYESGVNRNWDGQRGTLANFRKTKKYV